MCKNIYMYPFKSGNETINFTNNSKNDFILWQQIQQSDYNFVAFIE